MRSIHIFKIIIKTSTVVSLKYTVQYITTLTPTPNFSVYTSNTFQTSLCPPLMFLASYASTFIQYPTKIIIIIAGTTDETHLLFWTAFLRSLSIG